MRFGLLQGYANYMPAQFRFNIVGHMLLDAIASLSRTRDCAAECYSASLFVN